MKHLLNKNLFILSISIGIVLLIAAGCRPPQEAVAPASQPLAPAAAPAERPATSEPAPIASIDAPPGTPKELRKIFEVWSILSRDFVDKEKLDPKKGSSSAIEAIIKSLGDPYTAYIDAEHFSIDSTGFDGSFDGIGAIVSIRNNRLTIVSPIENSPASQAGIRAGDIILKIEGVSTDGMTITQAVNLIRGPRGTKVTITVIHPNERDPVEITIVRGRINLDSVSSQMLEGNISHIRLNQFTQRTPSELRDALQKAKEQGVKGIVLDLRGNPGGLLDATVQVASEFIEDGVVLYEVDGRGNRQELRARKGGTATKVPLAVLINGGSASGSEVLAGALQDYGRAPLIGMKTFGKGSVNIMRRLSDGSGLYITIARWHTPKGNVIEGKGLTPDFEVILTPEDRRTGTDTQLARALKYIQEHLAALSP